jgi:phospholipid/cholesterol/gamma-HCH transport system ATP-binding protein
VSEISLNKTSQPVSEVKEACLNFGPKVILDNFSLTLEPGSKVSLFGESSCGKSTALKLLVGLMAPDRGQVKLFGRDLANSNHRELDRLRRRVGMQFQAGALFDSLTVGRNILLAYQECSRGRNLKPISSKEIVKKLEEVGLGHTANLKPSQLSGGMKKRAALARALIASPDLAVFDEPTAGLDPVTASHIINFLTTLASSTKAALILAPTDIDVARRFSDDLALLHQGRLYLRGSLKTFTDSTDPYVVGYLSRHRLAQVPT